MKNLAQAAFYGGLLALGILLLGHIIMAMLQASFGKTINGMNIPFQNHFLFFIGGMIFGIFAWTMDKLSKQRK